MSSGLPYYLLTMTVNVSRKTLAANDFSAAAAETFAVSRAGLKCTIQPIGSRELMKYGKLTGEMTHEMFYNPPTDIRPRDRITGVWPQSIAGKTFEVAGPQRDAAGRGHHYETPLLERVEN